MTDTSRTDARPSWVRGLLIRVATVYFVLYAAQTLVRSYAPQPQSPTVTEALLPAWRWVGERVPALDLSDEREQEMLQGASAAYAWLMTPMGTWGDIDTAAVDLTAEHVLGISSDPYLERPRGSGDPTYSYVRLITLSGVSLIVALLWLLVERRRRSDRHIARAVWVAARFYLAATLLSYGFAKVSQFPSPAPSALLVPIGDKSPMGMLWTFMGASQAYCWFAGAGEALGGLLLFCRRTATLGGLVSAGVMANVVAMNFCYDVPVKLFSSHLLLCAILIAGPDLGRLARLLVFRRTVEPRSLGPWLPWRWARIPLRLLKYGAVAILLTNSVFQTKSTWEALQTAPPPLSGIWQVETQSREGQVIPLDHAQRWQALALNPPWYWNPTTYSGQVRTMDGRALRSTWSVDEQASTARMERRASWQFVVQDDSLILRGEPTHSSKKDWSDVDEPALPREPQIELVLERQLDPGPWASVAEVETTTGDDPATDLGSDESDESPPSIPEPLVGVWRVVARETGSMLSYRRADWSGWEELTCVDGKTARVRWADGTVDTYDLEFGSDDGMLTLVTSTLWTYQQEGDRLTLDGTLRGHDTRIVLRQKPMEEFLLKRRGFHWINENPLNR